MPEIDIKKQKILIVEDNPHFRTLIQSILQALGVENIEEARDGAEAMEVLRGYDADLAILDWKMDGVDGIECVRRIRNDTESPNRFLPIIMLTGYTEESLMNEARNAGVNDFLGKPISAKSLLTRIASVLDQEFSYVETETYFGPDRRRQQFPHQGNDRRKEQMNFVELKIYERMESRVG